MKELEELQKQADIDSKLIVEIMHERDILTNILTKNAIKDDKRSKQQIELVMRHEAQANTPDKDLKRWKAELRPKLHSTHEMDKQRERYSGELAAARGRFEDANEELENRDNTAAQLKRHVAEVKANLGKQMNPYEAVRTDKSLYGKDWVESQAEIADVEEKFRMMHLQIEQLLGKIKENEEAIVEQHSELQSKSEEKEETQEAGASASMLCRSRRGARRSLGRPPDIRMAGN